MTRIVEQLRAPRAVTPPASAPGPWSLDGLSVVCGGFRSHPARKIVCTVRSHPNTPAAMAEAESTARLVAAAPELRDVCASFSVVERDGRIVLRVLGVEVAALDPATSEAMILRQLGANRSAAVRGLT